MKISFFDIETFPLLGYAWQLYDARILKVVKDWELASFAHKFMGEKQVRCVSRRLFSEKELVQKLWKLIDESDIVVAHNGDAFDVSKTYSKFIQFGLKQPSPVMSVDTKKMAKARFRFSSNSLADIARLLKLGSKIDTGGFSLWDDCMAGKKEAWLKMEEYNKHDVVLLEKVYLALRPWAKSHPNVGDRDCCPRCGSPEIQLRGVRRTITKAYRRYQCMTCGGWSSSEAVKEEISKLKPF